MKSVLRRYGLFMLMGLWVLGMCLVTMTASPIYTTNQWVDTNAMLTMGRSWLHGLVPFRDLVEQRGPIFYGLYALAALISKHSFLGVFVIEVVNAWLTYALTYKIARSLQLGFYQALILGLLGPTVLVGTNAFEMGGSPEEFAFPVILYFIYLAIQWVDRVKPVRLGQFFLAGLGLAYLFWIKYSMIGALVVFFLYVGVDLIIHRRWLHLAKVVAVSLGGFMFPTMVIGGYFASQHALRPLIDTYFTLNMNAYALNFNGRIWNLVQNVKLLAQQIKMHWLLMMITLVGTAFLKGRRGPNHLVFYMFLSSMWMVVMSRFIRGYYVLTLWPFFVVVLLVVMRWLLRSYAKNWSALAMLVMLASVVLPFYGNDHISQAVVIDQYKPFLAAGQPSDKSVQVQFADKIHQTGKKPTLLMLNQIDSGFYLAANSYPNTRYFHRLNISVNQYPAMYDNFNDTLKHKRVNFVVVLVPSPGGQRIAVNQTNYLNGVINYNKEAVKQNYRLVDSGYQMLNGKGKNWALLEVK